MAETTDHDALIALGVQSTHIMQQQSESRVQMGRLEGKVDAVRQQLASVEARTLELEHRPEPVLPPRAATALVEEHREMYAFFSTFKGYIYPLILSGPLSAVVSSLLTYFIINIHASGK